jgi:hypothetical protein
MEFIESLGLDIRIKTKQMQLQGTKGPLAIGGVCVVKFIGADDDHMSRTLTDVMRNILLTTTTTHIDSGQSDYWCTENQA